VPLPAASPAPITRLPVAAQAARLNADEQSPEDDLDTVELLLSQYRRHLGGNPVGDNVDITASLLGRNPKSLAYLPESGAFLDRDGHLIDRWGTPYFFHAVSGIRLEIRSAGPDRELWTDDDLVR